MRGRIKQLHYRSIGSKTALPTTAKCRYSLGHCGHGTTGSYGVGCGLRHLTWRINKRGAFKGAQTYSVSYEHSVRQTNYWVFWIGRAHG